MLHKAVWYARQRGRASEVEEMAMISMEVRSEVLGEDNAETLSSIEMVGLARRLRDKYEETWAIHRQTLARREKIPRYKHPETLTNIYTVLPIY